MATASLQNSPKAQPARCPNAIPRCKKSRKKRVGDRMVVDVCLVKGMLNRGLTRSLGTTKEKQTSMNLK